jgi:tRNA(Ile)-lysidine synthase TilS/MesJ
MGVVHVDHGLRGEESGADAAWVESLVGRLGYNCLTYRADTARYAREHRLGLEEAGRYVRYQAFAAAAASESAWAVATGHTVDDLAETVLIKLLRGTGPLGITGMSADHPLDIARLGPPARLIPRAGHADSAAGKCGQTPSAYSASPRLRVSASAEEPALRVIRPLLAVERVQTERYCAELGLEFRRDPSNIDPSFLRNRVRHQLLPLLRTYNPSIVDSLARLGQLAADDEAELDRAVEKVGSRKWALRQAQDELGSGKGGAMFDWHEWLALSPAIQRRLLRRAAQELTREAWSFQSLESARLLLAKRPAGRRISLGGGVRLTTTNKGFRLVKSGDSGRQDR